MTAEASALPDFDLSTTYLGLQLRTPLVASSGPLTARIDSLRALEAAGISAVVLPSLFEEQVEHEDIQAARLGDLGSDSNPEATSYFPDLADYESVADRYLRHVEEAKKALSIPVLASLNGETSGGWVRYARLLELAGADAIELNLYHLITDPHVGAGEVEADMLETVRSVTSTVKIPVAVKLSAFHTAPAQFAMALEEAGAAGVVVFNRFYQPDLNIEELEVQPQLKLSDPSELLMRLRWLAIISPHLKGSLSATGGAHSADDIAKAILAGAHTVQLVSVLLKHGPRVLSTLLNGLQHWMGEHGYTSVEEFRGAMNLSRCPDPAAFERANYQRILQSWRV